MTDCIIPSTLEELGEALSHITRDSAVLAGGTDLILHLRRSPARPDCLLSLGGIPELQEISVSEESAHIGAMAVMRDIHAELNGIPDLQVLADAAGSVGSPQIRNKGTIGGNVANASPAADLPPALWLLNAEADLMGPCGVRRTLSVRDLAEREFSEVILGFRVYRRAMQGWRTAFVKLGHRSQVTISRIGMAMALRQEEDGRIEDARLVVGAIKPVPFPLPAAEELMRGQYPSSQLAIDIGETFVGNTRRIYKEDAAKGVAEDVLRRFPGFRSC